MSKVKIELESWSDAELDLIGAAAVAGMLSTSLFNDGQKADSEVAYSVCRAIESALNHIECGRIRGD